MRVVSGVLEVSQLVLVFFSLEQQVYSVIHGSHGFSQNPS